MKHLAWLASVLLVVSTVSAQDASVPSAADKPAAAAGNTLGLLVIEVRAQRVSRTELEGALAAELKQGQSEAEKPKGALELSDSATNTVRLTYRDALGRVTTRDLYIEPNDPETLEKITIAAANLVRDQSGAISQLEAAQRAEEEAALAALSAAPATAPPAAPAAPAKPAYDPCHPPHVIPFGFDFAWKLGTSSAENSGQTARKFSLGFLGTYGGGVQGAQLSIGANVDKLGVCGVELAVGLNLNLGETHGAQLSLVNVGWGELHGAQLGLINFTGKDAHGAQLSIANVSLAAATVQLGVANIAGGPTAAQVGVLNFAKGEQLQMGVTNIDWADGRGQLGVLNIARGEVRTQLGVVNYAGRARAPVGLINIVKDGRTGVDLWANENGALIGMLTHGGDRVYNMYGVGTRVQKGGSRLAILLGIGSRLYTDDNFGIDLQVSAEMYPHVNPFKNYSTVERIRLAADIKLSDRISLVPAIGYALMWSDHEGEPIQAPFGVSQFKKITESHSGLWGFPSFGLGFRVMLAVPKTPLKSTGVSASED